MPASFTKPFVGSERVLGAMATTCVLIFTWFIATFPYERTGVRAHVNTGANWHKQFELQLTSLQDFLFFGEPT